MNTSPRIEISDSLPGGGGLYAGPAAPALLLLPGGGLCPLLAMPKPQIGQYRRLRGSLSDITPMLRMHVGHIGPALYATVHVYLAMLCLERQLILLLIAACMCMLL